MLKAVTFKPSRIGCPSIPGTMKGIVASLKGVEKVTVHYEERTLEITFDDARISPDDIIKTIGKEMGLAMQVADTASDNKGKPTAAETCPM